MKIIKLRLNDPSFPERLRHIPDPPQHLYLMGDRLNELLTQPSLAVIGSRAVSPYGRLVTERLTTAASRQGITIVSGLALGIDGLAHQTALQTGGNTIAVLPCGLDTPYPASHRNLAKQILKQGGALLSEYPTGTDARREHFIARNRLISGLSDAVLIPEAAEKSGSLHTARFALEQGRDVLAVPGNITNPNSQGTNNLIKSGAIPIIGKQDILSYFKVNTSSHQRQILGSTAEEQTILELIQSGLHDPAELIAKSHLNTATFNQALTMLEITGQIKASAGFWYLL